MRRTGCFLDNKCVVGLVLCARSCTRMSRSYIELQAEIGGLFLSQSSTSDREQHRCDGAVAFTA